MENALVLPGAVMICLGHSGYHFGLSGSGLIGKVFGQQQQQSPHSPLVAPHIR